MTNSEMAGLQILVLAMPVIVAAMALFTVWLTDRLERREDRRPAQHTVAGE